MSWSMPWMPLSSPTRTPHAWPLTLPALGVAPQPNTLSSTLRACTASQPPRPTRTSASRPTAPARATPSHAPSRHAPVPPQPARRRPRTTPCRPRHGRASPLPATKPSSPAYISTTPGLYPAPHHLHHSLSLTRKLQERQRRSRSSTPSCTAVDAVLPLWCLSDAAAAKLLPRTTAVDPKPPRRPSPPAGSSPAALPLSHVLCPSGGR